MRSRAWPGDGSVQGGEHTELWEEWGQWEALSSLDGPDDPLKTVRIKPEVWNGRGEGPAKAIGL